MLIVNRSVLTVAAAKHPPARVWIAAWLKEVEKARWSSPQDIKDRYRSASLLNGNDVIFNVRGNTYRLAVEVFYPRGLVKVQKFGTHAEYDRW